MFGFKKKRKCVYLVIAYWVRPKVGEVQKHQPLIVGIYKDIEKAKRCVDEIKYIGIYDYVTFVSITTDL